MSNNIKKLVIPGREGKVFQVTLSDIVYIKSDGSISKIWLEKNIFLTAFIGINRLEKILTSNEFCRVHRQYIVNLKFVEDFGSYPKHEIEVHQKHTIPVAKRRRRFLQVSFQLWKKQL